MKINEVIEQITDFHKMETNKMETKKEEKKPHHTCDTVKAGEAEAECTGIVTTCFASYDVVKRAAAAGANLIICHEPTFYSHEDETAWLESDPIYRKKKQLIQETGMVIWRDHDSIHGSPAGDVKDRIFIGIMHELGWEDYLVQSENKPLYFKIPKRTKQELAEELIDKLNLTGMRIVGDMQGTVEKVFLSEHVDGRKGDSRKIQFVSQEDIDVIIPFEIIDWTLSEYIRDASMTGSAKAIFEMGHFNVEELGMKYMAKWLSDLLRADFKIEYVQSGDSFRYMTSYK